MTNRRIHEPAEVRPCGVAGGLTPLCNQFFRFKPTWQTDLSDCLVTRPKPFRIVIWEPLATKAPAPPKCTPWCCYTQTVIFYHSPYVVSPWVRFLRTDRGRWLRNSSPGHFEQWDQIEYRLAWDDVVEFEGEQFAVGSGTVLWTGAEGERRRWWMLHHARRREADRRAA